MIRLLVLLRRVGWHASLRGAETLGAPAPWMNLSAIALLGCICREGTTIIEYGCGSSTRWLAERGCTVTSIEHDEEWARSVRTQLAESSGGENCRVELVEPAAYARAPRDLGVSSADVVIVDGINRVECVVEGVQLLTSSGVLVLDDSHRPDYDAAFEFLGAQGFDEVTVWGPKFGPHGGAPATSFFRRGRLI